MRKTIKDRSKGILSISTSVDWQNFVSELEFALFVTAALCYVFKW